MAKAAQKPQELNINLIQKEETAPTGSEVLHWVLTVGRYLVIAAEVIALGTFVLAIKFSADKNDLKQRIKAAQIEVDSKAACPTDDKESFCEDRFRNVQNRINYIATFRSSQFQQNQALTEFLARLPQGFTLKTLSLEPTKISFSGTFANTVQLQSLISSFSNSEKIVDLNIEELQSPTTTDPNYNFKASASLNKVAFKTSQNNSGSNQ